MLSRLGENETGVRKLAWESFTAARVALSRFMEFWVGHFPYIIWSKSSLFLFAMLYDL